MRIRTTQRMMSAGLVVMTLLPVAGNANEPGPPEDPCAPPRDSACEERLWLPRFFAPPCDSTGVEGWAVWLNSEPFGAQVRFGGRVLGVTPLWVTRKSVSERSLQVSFPGYKAVTVGLEFMMGDLIDVRLEPLNSGPGEDGRSHRRGFARFRRRPLQYGLALLGSGSAVLGLHCKRRADEAYDEYLRTGNNRKIREHFDRAETYDRCALGCWLVAEVSLVALLYLLMDTPEAGAWNVHTAVEEAGDGCGVKIEWTF